MENKRTRWNRFGVRPGCLLIVLALFTAPCAAAEDEEGATGGGNKAQPVSAERLYYLDVYERIIDLVERPSTLSESTIRGIPLVRLSLYRVGDKRNRHLPADLYAAIEQRLTTKLLATGRFQIHECMECKTTKVTMREDSFSILRQVESNERLKQIGEQVGVEGFLLWDIVDEYDKAVLNARVVDASSGRIVWSQQYMHEYGRKSDIDFYIGAWGIDASRKAVTATNDDVKISNFLVFGSTLNQRSTISDNIYYGVGADMFLNLGQRAVVDLTGVSVYGKVSFELDYLVDKSAKDYGNWLLYMALGPAIYKSTQSLLFKGGLEVRFSQTSFMDLGVIYLPEKEVNGSEQTGFADGITFGGIGYNLAIGKRF